MIDPMEDPYIGPRTFEEKHRHLFFGREREARELRWMVMSEPLVLFYAQSGAGKSSLINARLVPGLRREGCEVLPIGRLGGELPADIDQVDNIFVFNLLLSLERRHAAARDLARTCLSDYLSRRATNGQPRRAGEAGDDGQRARVLIIDQFEEIFTTHLDRWRQREEFFRQLQQAISRDPRLWAVLTIREDHVAALDPYARLFSDRLRARFYMQRMGCEAALQAIKKPAADHGRPFAPEAAQSLVDNLRQIRVHEQAQPCLGEFVESVQLQVVCYRLWQNLKARPPAQITQQDVQALGDVDTALADFYEGVIAEVMRAAGQSEIELRDWFERELITEAGTRGTVYQGPEQTGGLANPTVQLLVERFLLRPDVRSGLTWYELVHDRFVEPILGANQAWRQDQSGLVQAALAWKESGRSDDRLYRGPQFRAAVASNPAQPGEPLVAEFLRASWKFNQDLEKEEAQRQRELKQAQDLAEARRRELENAQALVEVEQQRAEDQVRAKRRLRRRAWILSFVFALLVVAAVLALDARSDWRAEKVRSAILKALAYYEREDYRRAIDNYTEAITLDPNHPQARYGRGIAYGKSGEWEEAIKDLTRYIAIDDDYASAYYNRGYAYAGLRDYKQAIDNYKKAIKLDDDYAAAYYALGRVYVQNNYYEQAIDNLKKAIDRKPGFTMAYYYRGLAYGNQGNYEEAIADFNQAIRLYNQDIEYYPTHVKSYYYRGLSYRNQGNFDQAIADLEKALQMGLESELKQKAEEQLEKLKR